MKQTKKQLYREDVLRLFYRTQLRQGEEIINNQDGVIARELNIKQGLVYEILAEEMISKVKMAGKKPLNTNEKKIIEKKPKEFEDLEVEYKEVKPPIQYPISPKTKNKKGQYSKEPTLYFNP